jgi:hypothetical protein
VDPCHPDAAFVHMICVPGSTSKILRLQDMGWWMLCVVVVFIVFKLFARMRK